MENKIIKVLLVEDERTLAMIIKDTLENEGFSIDIAYDGKEGLKKYDDHSPDIIVSDVMMPVMDGFEMVRRIRASDGKIPVLFLTARSAVKDVVEGFELGANDYLKKPFGMQELMVRINALLNRIHPKVEESHLFAIGNYSFDSTFQKLNCGEKTFELSFRESEILKRLCLNLNSVANTKSILLDLWGDDNFFNSRSLQVFITKLRHKLSCDERIKIINVRGIGYKLIVE